MFVKVLKISIDILVNEGVEKQKDLETLDLKGRGFRKEERKPYYKYKIHGPDDETGESDGPLF